MTVLTKITDLPKRKHLEEAYLDDIAEMTECGWCFRWFHNSVDYRGLRKSTMGHYFTGHWHPLAVSVDTYVMDDFGNLFQVYKGETW